MRKAPRLLLARLGPASTPWLRANRAVSLIMLVSFGAANGAAPS